MLPLLLLPLLLGPLPPDLRATGVVFAPAAQRRAAVLASGGKTRIVQPGETVFGVRLLSVEEDRVRVETDRGSVDLPIAEDPSAPRVVETVAPHGDPGLSMERAELERRIGAEATRIMAETTLIPVTDGGEVAGFALTRLPEGTVLSEAGLRAGDVLQRINDVQIDSFATLAGLWTQLQGASSIRAELVRDGRPMTLTLDLH